MLQGLASWWQRGVVYQVYPRSFLDSNGDGTGDLPGITRRLDYLSQTLGVDAIWLSPFYPSPMADFGYDVSNFTDVDPLFGSLADFDHLLVEAHARALKIIVDFVPNHTSEEHPWFVESRSSRTSPKRDWYVWRDPGPGGMPPNNWLAAFGGPSWEWDEGTGQFYLHSFLKEQPDLNWRNPEVRAAMMDVLRFWLDRGVDGFRMDAIHRILKDPELRDNPPAPEGARLVHKPMGAYEMQLHIHDRGHPDIHGVLREMRQVLEAASTPEQPRVAIGEMHIFELQELTGYYGEALDELHLPFNFGLLKSAWEAGAIRSLVSAYEAALPVGAWPNYVLGNHDEPRIATRVGPEYARLAMMLLLTLRGTPTLYYGDELGMVDVTIAPEEARDPWGKMVPGLYLGRDPARTPMPWDGSANSGFCPPDVSPWLPLGLQAQVVNVAAQLEDQGSMLSLTRRLLALRRSSLALAVGDYAEVPDLPPQCYAFTRTAEAEQLLVALNFSAEECDVRLPGLGSMRPLVSTAEDDPRVESVILRLRGGEGVILGAGG